MSTTSQGKLCESRCVRQMIVVRDVGQSRPRFRTGRDHGGDFADGVAQGQQRIEKSPLRAHAGLRIMSPHACVRASLPPLKVACFYTYSLSATGLHWIGIDGDSNFDLDDHNGSETSYFDLVPACRS